MPRMIDALAPIIAKLKNNPNIVNNPMASGALEALESGDAKRGEQMAANICESMGVSQDEAVRQAKAFFNIP